MRNNKIILAAAAALACAAAAAQGTDAAVSAREGAMGGIVLFCPAENHATLAYQAPFAMHAMACKRLAVQWSRRGTVAFDYSHTGNNAYNLQQLLAGYSLRVGSHSCLGVAVELRSAGTSLPQPRTRTLSTWVTAHHEQGRIAATLAAGWLTPPGEAARPAALATLRFAPSARSLVSAQAERLERWRIRLGMEQAVCDALWLRAGLATNPLTASFGAGTRLGALRADVSTNIHSALGISPQLSITLCF